MRKRIVLAAAVACAGLTGAALADSHDFNASTSRFNPGHAPVSIGAHWVPGLGIPGQGSGQGGLLLAISQTVAFPPGASADATITGVKGKVLTELGMDHLMGTYCTNGSPRWDVELSNGGVYAFGCSAGTHSAIPGASNWERIRYGNADVQNLSGPAWPGFGNACCKVTFLQVLSDEGPSATVLDNLDVNGTLIRGGEDRGDDNSAVHGRSHKGATAVVAGHRGAGKKEH